MNDIDLNCEPLQAFVGDRISNSLAFHASGTTGNQNAATWSIPVATACGITMELIDIEGVQTAPKTELAPIERAAIALESTKTEQHLMALATKHQSITVVKDKAGREQAHGAYIEVMRARTAVEKAAKDAREDATKFSKAVIAEAARLVAIVEPEEARLKEARDVWDAEQARIKAEAEAKERAELERMRAELEAKSKPAEQPAKEPVGNASAPTSGATSQPIADSEPVACANGEEATEKPEAPRAPVASAIVLAVAEFWHTDNKTAARWITERAAEIATLKG